MSVTVILADDHQVVRQGIRAVLERAGIQVLGEAADGLDAVRLAQELQPDIAVLDVTMPGMNGISVIKEIARVSPRTKSILLTMHTEDHYLFEALRAGAKGFVLKTQAAEQLLQAIHDVFTGSVYLSPSVSGIVVQAYLAKSELPADPLTSRERQVLQLIAEAKTTKQVAVILGVTVKTAESHRTRLMEKLDIHSTAGLVRYAVRKGVVQP
jgi:two-component system, NarL family, response regulator NreC